MSRAKSLVPPVVVPLICALCAAFFAPAAPAAPAASGAATIKAAVAKSLPLLERSARGSMEKRSQCFTCHNQALPVLALTTARGRGFAIDEENLSEQVEFTAAFLAKGRENYLAGKGQGGKALTAGYALWTLENGGRAPDETTAAVTDYLLAWQRDLDHWEVQTIRPPSEESLLAVSYFALRGLKAFGEPGRREDIDRRFGQVREWALATPARSTEDLVFRLWLLHVADADEAEVRRAAEDLSAAQRADGGWAQLPDMPGDAYATGTALVALCQAGALATSGEVYQRGLDWLIAAQLEDGSWHVRTRSTPIQTYYESGYPHGEDQFISITAAGWATTALALALPGVAAEQVRRPAREPAPAQSQSFE